MTTLYSTKCSKCNIVEKKLKEKNIEYFENNNVNQMLEMGLSTVPWLEVDGEMMDFNQAVKWINEQ